MGAFLSVERSNDGLVNDLVKTRHIKSPSVERVFRSVDRGAYIIDFPQVYDKDKSWKRGNVDLSSPIIYATVLENLDLQPGMHFLNLGSGSGYLSTMCGLLIGKKGVNHGVEVHGDVVSLARTKVEEFLKTAEFDFCPPKVIVGNLMNIVPTPKTYDRIYLGAACPDYSVGRIIDMLKLGGICIVPIGDSLVKITRSHRLNYDQYNRKVILNARVTDVIYPGDNVGNRGNKLRLPPIPQDQGFQALARIPGVTMSNVQEWLQTAKLVHPWDPIYDDICQYIGNSQDHGFGIKVLKIIRIIRKNDPPLTQLDPTLKTKLRMLLWHGTQVQSVPSILQHGFKVPQLRGQMFGRGIYFADRASKSANYSAKKKNSPQTGEIGYMFLCDVLLGDIYNARTPRQWDSKPPKITTNGEATKPCDSVKCTGEYVPDEQEQKMIAQNVILPYGKTIKNKRFPSYAVKFNEFTVYSGDRCKPLYLVEFQFTPRSEQYSKTCGIK